MRRNLRNGLIGLVCLIFVGVGWGAFVLQDAHVTAKGELLRFHVLANSDSPRDQQLKLYVRDAVIQYLAPYFDAVDNADSAKAIVLAHREELEALSERVLRLHGADYKVKVKIGVFQFPIKSYGELVLPAGKYEAVRVLIGNAQGHNWWCVLFPPLCFIDITNATAAGIKSDVGPDDGRTVEYKSKLLEIIHSYTKT
jgi:stage II sporulation protein R